MARTDEHTGESAGTRWELVLPLDRELLAAITTTAALVAHGAGIVSGPVAGLLVALVAAAVVLSRVTVRRGGAAS